MRKFSYQEFLNGPAHAHVALRAYELQEIILTRHDNAPRGGDWLNAFGEPRSAPGEDPAIEFGDLRDAIERGVTETGRLQFDVVANRVGLEFGEPENNVKPRPMGRHALEEHKARLT